MPSEIDAMYPWECAEFLGVGHYGYAEETQRADGARVSSGRAPGRKRDIIAERMAHAAGLGPKPEPDPPDPSVLAMLTRLGDGSVAGATGGI